MVDKNLFIKYAPELYDIGKKIADGYKRELKNVDAVATGTLLNFKWDIKNDNNGLKLVFYLPEYWRYIEFSRRPTKNDGNGEVRRKIREWIDMKGIEPSVKYDNRGRKYLPTKNQLAYLISRKIHAKGYDERRPLTTALTSSKRLQQDFVNTVSKMLCKDTTEMILMMNTTK